MTCEQRIKSWADYLPHEKRALINKWWFDLPEFARFISMGRDEATEHYSFLLDTCPFDTEAHSKAEKAFYRVGMDKEVHELAGMARQLGIIPEYEQPEDKPERFVTQEALEKTIVDHQKEAAKATSAMIEKLVSERESCCGFSGMTETLKKMHESVESIPVVEVAPKQPDVFDFALSCLEIAANSKESRVYADFDSGVRFGEFVCALHKMLSTPTGMKEAA